MIFRMKCEFSIQRPRVHVDVSMVKIRRHFHMHTEYMFMLCIFFISHTLLYFI